MKISVYKSRVQFLYIIQTKFLVCISGFINIQKARGIGLFMVKTQVETIGGNISVTSEVN
ncbi:MAG: hypothetical protein H7257_01100 [Taibaiella sp.]|nr:hypothetical protein [Taibaiella sp.]